MTRRRAAILGAGAVLAGGLIAAPLLFARGGGFGHFGHGRGHGEFGRVVRVFHELDLTREQRDAMHRIHDAAKDRNRQPKAALHDGLMEAARILIADPQNVAAARAAIEARETAIDQLKDNTLTAVAEAVAVLTPEQRAKLAEHLEEHAKQLAR